MSINIFRDCISMDLPFVKLVLVSFGFTRIINKLMTDFDIMFAFEALHKIYFKYFYNEFNKIWFLFHALFFMSNK